MLLLGGDRVDSVVVGEDEEFAFGVFDEGGRAEFLVRMKIFVLVDFSFLWSRAQRVPKPQSP